MISINAQTIRSPSGDELVVMPKAEFDALMEMIAEFDEDAADATIFDERMAELSAGKDARLPPEVTSAMLRGDSLLRALRRWRDETQMHIAFKTGLAQGYISDLETGRKVGSPEALRMIAEVLQVDPSWLGVGE
jgi:hypothetical protein